MAVSNQFQLNVKEKDCGLCDCGLSCIQFDVTTQYIRHEERLSLVNPFHLLMAQQCKGRQNSAFEDFFEDLFGGINLNNGRRRRSAISRTLR